MTTEANCDARFQTVSGTTITCECPLDDGRTRCAAHDGWVNDTEQSLVSASRPTSTESEMDYPTFMEQFKDLYLRERRRQELQGVVAIRSKDLIASFLDQHKISKPSLEGFFNKLKSTGVIFSTVEMGDELIQWVE